MRVFLNTLYITTPDAYLRLEGETVCVMAEKEKRPQVLLHHLCWTAKINLTTLWVLFGERIFVIVRICCYIAPHTHQLFWR